MWRELNYLIVIICLQNKQTNKQTKSLYSDNIGGTEDGIGTLN
jgi:hypothetical protein